MRRCRQPGGHRTVSDRARETAVADTLKLAIPVRAGKPDFQVDVGIGGRFGHHGHPAEGGNIGNRRALGWSKGARGYRLRTRDRGVRKREPGQVAAGRPSREGRCGKEQEGQKLHMVSSAYYLRSFRSPRVGLDPITSPVAL
jgi:hypothetical protein